MATAINQTIKNTSTPHGGIIETVNRIPNSTSVNKTASHPPILPDYSKISLLARAGTMQDMRGINKEIISWHRKLLMVFVVLVLIVVLQLRAVQQKWSYFINRIDIVNAYAASHPAEGLPGLPSGLECAMCMEWQFYNTLKFGDQETFIPALMAAYYSTYLADCMSLMSSGDPGVVELQTIRTMYGLTIGKVAPNIPSVNQLLCNTFTQKSSPGTNPAATGLPDGVCYPVCQTPAYVQSSASDNEGQAERGLEMGMTAFMVMDAVVPELAVFAAIGGIIGGIFMAKSAQRAKREREIQNCKQTRTTCYWPDGAKTCDGVQGAIKPTPCSLVKQCQSQGKVACLQQNKCVDPSDLVSTTSTACTTST